jgi:RNA polymerase sigma factor (sigma-70 family)
MALRDAMNSYGNRLRRFLQRRLPDPTELDDVLQDVFFALARRLQMPEPIEDVGAWLFRVARSKLADRYRSNRPASLPLAPEADGDDAPLLPPLLAGADDGPEAAYERELVWVALNEALAELPPEQREAFVRNELEGESFQQIAHDTGVPLGTLLSRKRYAVQYLRRRLQTLYDEFSFEL